jgi:signal transduction histidine kinase
MTRDGRSSLHTQLLITVGLIAIAAVVAVAVASRYGTRLEFLRFQDTERRAMVDPVRILTAVLAQRLDGRCCAADQLEAARGRLGPDQALLVVGDGDGALAGSTGPPLDALSGLAVRRRGAELGIDAVRRHPDGSLEQIALMFRSAGTPIRLTDGRPALLYVLPFPSESRARAAAAFLGSLDQRLLGVTALVAVLVVCATWLVARRTVRPIDDLRAATRELAAGRLDRRVEPAGAREVADLARAFNAMADELERQQALRRTLVTDVAHELRTPLTALQCRLETVQDGLAADPDAAIRQAHEEVLHLGRLVDDLQDLALAEARELRLDVRDVEMGALVSSAASAAGLDGDSRVGIDVPHGIVARCDPIRTRQMVLNLLTNARRYTPADGTIMIRAACRKEEVVVEVVNTGSRLEPEEAARIFDRFYRTDPSRQRVTGGTGLGLAIVKHLAEAQGGRVWARSDGNGVTVGFSVPR